MYEVYSGVPKHEDVNIGVTSIRTGYFNLIYINNVAFIRGDDKLIIMFVSKYIVNNFLITNAIAIG